MKIAHLILAHKAPIQLERLLQALAHPQTACYIHLDSKANYKVFAGLAELPNVYFIHNRIDVRWGGYSLTQASLQGMREILKNTQKYDFINVLSGEDYPIKPLDHIHNYFAQRGDQSFAEYKSIESPWWQANKTRFTHYHLTEFNFWGSYALEKTINLLLPERKFPLPVYGGNMGGWYTLNHKAANYLLRYLDTNTSLSRFAKFSWGSDEFIVQTVLLNSPFGALITNNNLRYIDWSGGGSSPKVLTVNDLPLILNSNKLFARKLDLVRDVALFDELDKLNKRDYSLK